MKVFNNNLQLYLKMYITTLNKWILFYKVIATCMLASQYKKFSDLYAGFTVQEILRSIYLSIYLHDLM